MDESYGVINGVGRALTLYCEHDIVKNNVNFLIGAGTTLGFIDGCENISLSGPKKTAIAHEPYMVYRRIQEELELTQREIGAYKLDSKNLEILNDDASVLTSKQLTNEQMASIALQFNEEHFLTMAYQKAFADKKEEGLLGYIEKLRGILSSNPFSQIRTKGLDKESATIKDINTNEFNEFKNSLNEYLDKIDPMATKSPTLKYLAHNTRKLLDNYQRTNFDTLKENLEKQEKNNLEHVANTAISAKSIISELQNIASLLKTSKEKYANAQQDLKNMTDGLISKNFSVTVKFLYDLEEHGWLKQSAQVSSDISRKIRICVKLDELNQKMATLDEKDTDKIKAIKEEIDRKRPTNHIYQIISA